MPSLGGRSQRDSVAPLFIRYSFIEIGMYRWCRCRCRAVPVRSVRPYTTYVR